MKDDNTSNDPNAELTTTAYNELKWNMDPPLDAAAAEGRPTPSSDKAPPTIISTSEKSESSSFLPLHAERTALLVVDVQPEYWSQCPAVRRDFPHFPENLRRTVDACRKQKCCKIIWVRADYRYSHSPWLKQFARIHGLEDGGGGRAGGSSSSSQEEDGGGDASSEFRTEVPCDRDSDRFSWEDFAVPTGGEVIIPKPSWSSTTGTALTDVLRASSVDTVLVCGLITSVCVQHSAFGVFEAGYRTVMVTDACADRGRARHEAALALYGDYMYELLTSGELSSATSARRLRPARPIFILPPKQDEGSEETPGHEKRFCVYESPVLSPSSVPAVESASSLSSATSSSSLSSFTEFTI